MLELALVNLFAENVRKKESNLACFNQKNRNAVEKGIIRTTAVKLIFKFVAVELLSSGSVCVHVQFWCHAKNVFFHRRF